MIINVNRKTWELYGAHIIESQNLFSESLRTPADEYLHILRTKDHIFKIYLDKKKYIGHIILYKPALVDMSYHGFKGKNDFLYLFELIVHPDYQGKGYGSTLVNDIILETKKKGFNKIRGHFRQNGSLKIMKKLGARELSVFKNWEKTGEDFVLCELDI